MIRRVDRYELLEQVGTGGMSVVYRGRDTSLDREVAVKVLHPHLATRPESRARFSREARAVARLSHPGIVEIHDYSGDDAPESWLVTEFVHGRTLRVFAEQVGFPLPEMGALVGLALADALVHAHAAGVIHRDLKPENVMISEAGGRSAVKLADFGIARILSQDDRMTMTGALVGSPNHMAPEVVDGGEADERSDIFSLGTILYWMCTGRLPFEGPNPSATLHRLVNGDFPDPRSVNPALSGPLARIIVSCLALDPAGRPASAEALRTELSDMLAADGIARPAEVLANFLTDPRGTEAALRPILVEARFRRGREHLARGEVALALSDFDGVLALEPDHPEVLASLATVARDDRRRRASRIAIGVVLGSAVTVLLVLGVARYGTSLVPGTEKVPDLPSSGSTSAGSPSPSPPTAGAGPAATPGVQEAGSVLRPPDDAQRPSTPRKAPNVPLAVLVRPYAQRVLLDGVEVAKDQQRVVLSLSPGVHRLRFEHTCCEPYDREISAASAEHLGEMKVPLVPRPALLRVGGDPSTQVYLDGKLLGSAGDSQRESFRVRVPQDGPSPYEGDVDLSLLAPGRRAISSSVRIRAGQDVVVPALSAEDARR